jgi:hypothetical protein
MLSNKCCTDGTIKGNILRETPTANDANYPSGFIGWTEDGGVYFHIGSGQWIELSGGGGGGSDAIRKIITDNGTATPNANGEVELKGVAAQGTSTSAP